MIKLIKNIGSLVKRLVGFRSRTYLRGHNSRSSILTKPTGVGLADEPHLEVGTNLATISDFRSVVYSQTPEIQHFWVFVKPFSYKWTEQRRVRQSNGFSMALSQNDWRDYKRNNNSMKWPSVAVNVIFLAAVFATKNFLHNKAPVYQYKQN